MPGPTLVHIYQKRFGTHPNPMLRDSGTSGLFGPSWAFFLHFSRFSAGFGTFFPHFSMFCVFSALSSYFLLLLFCSSLRMLKCIWFWQTCCGDLPKSTFSAKIGTFRPHRSYPVTFRKPRFHVESVLFGRILARSSPETSRRGRFQLKSALFGRILARSSPETS